MTRDRGRRIESESESDGGFLTSEIRFGDPTAEIGTLPRTPWSWVAGGARAAILSALTFALALGAGCVQMDPPARRPLLALGDGLAGESPRIRVTPGRVYPGDVYELRLEAERAGSVWKWKVGAGELISNGRSRVYWKAPSDAAVVTVEVAKIGEDGTADERCAWLELAVREPSTAGMVRIPAGTFVVGDSWTDVDDDAFIPTLQNMPSKPPHRVYLDEYWIDRTRVTNRQYAEFLEAARREGWVRVADGAALGTHRGSELPFYYFELKPPPSRPGIVPPLDRAIIWDGERFRVREGREDHQVVDVTWAGADAFARYHGKRLPSEAQWEAALRGPDLRPFAWGEELPTKYHAGNFESEGPGEVGRFSPTGDSPHGVSDTLGGFEWVDDWFGGFYFRDNYSDQPLENPRGQEWGRDRVARGVPYSSGFLGDSQYTNPLAVRYQWIFEFAHVHLFAHDLTGFRTALSLRKAEDEIERKQPFPDAELPLRPKLPFPLAEDASSYGY